MLEISINMILDSLAEYGPERFFSEEEQLSFSGLRLYELGQETLSTSNIYMCTSRELTAEAAESGCCFLCIHKMAPALKKKLQGRRIVLLEDEGFDALAGEVIRYIDEVYPDKHFTFKVNARRARKNYPLESMEINAQMGERILEAFPETSVDVHKPQVMFNIEIRNQINVYSTVIPGPGGMPVGTNGKAMLLLSGGIDSPVAGYMIAKRGVTIDATYFHAPPYTSERAKQKVVDLAKIISKYTGPINLHVVNFTDIQLYIYEQCPHEELTIIMRRYMMKLAEHFAKENKCLGLITGESIGQVASQTMQSLAATNEVCTMPVYRPLIGFDKQEIVEISEKIDAYETSILPYEDCCTIFVAKHPVTKPSLNVIHNDERKLSEKIDALMQEAIDTVEVIHIEA